MKRSKPSWLCEKGKKVVNKVEMPIVPLDSEDPSTKEKEDNNPWEYILKAPFSSEVS